MSQFLKADQYTEKTDGEYGFTLVELLVVLAIMSLAAVLFVGASGSSTGATAKGDLAKLESAIASARQQAISSAAVQEVIVADYALDLRPTIGGASKSLIFHADGSSNGGVILQAETQLFTVRWIDGRITQ
ncbi:prepilin-type N-terminal cleavage/methylation domain-containing protein [Parasphingorhabdus sp.]|uniref:prepilin-type N-terminal cleavage/methylation domain-containing protein n=1 Tax=Parasphingorhabdus sp. TaxID=2709688 RepID=UPI0032674BF0